MSKRLQHVHFGVTCRRGEHHASRGRCLDGPSICIFLCESVVEGKNGVRTTSFSKRCASIEDTKIALKNASAVCSGILRPAFGDNVWNLLEEQV